MELYIFGYAIFFPAHLSMNYSNIYFDIESDKNNTPTPISGGSKILIENPELKKIIMSIFIILMALSIILSLIFIIIYNYSIYFFIFVLFGNFIGLFYAAPPIRLSYRCLGEIALIITMGLIMPGFGYWVLSGGLDLFYFVFAFGLFLYGLVFIILVEIPDMDGDKKSNKNTLIVRVGRKLGYNLLIFALFFASIYYLLLAFLGIFSENINYIGIYLISLIPLIVVIKGWFNKPFKKKIATKIAVTNFFTLSFFFILIIVYLLMSIFII